MPIAAPIIAALIGAGTTGITTGLEAAGTFTPSSNSAQLKEQQTQDQINATKQQALQKQEIFKRFAPDVQSATGGALADKSFSQMVAELSGSPGDIGLAQQTIFGSGTPGQNSGLASGGE